jgi:HK97 gp10 family phage protein
LEAEVGSKGGAPYAKYLETGTKKMEARPFLKPAIEAHRDQIIEAFNKRFGEGFLSLEVK